MYEIQIDLKKFERGMNSVEETLILWWTWRGAPTARVCPLIMAGKAAAVQDRDVPRPNCYIYAKRGGGALGSVSLSYARAHGVIKPSGPQPTLLHVKTHAASIGLNGVDEKPRRNRRYEPRKAWSTYFWLFWS